MSGGGALELADGVTFVFGGVPACPLPGSTHCVACSRCCHTRAFAGANAPGHNSARAGPVLAGDVGDKGNGSLRMFQLLVAAHEKCASRALAHQAHTIDNTVAWQGPRADHIGDRHRLVARGRYKERVVLLLGNRDLNKMRFTSELAESEIKFACPPRCRVFGRVTLPGAAAAKTRTDSAWRLCASAPRSRLDAVEGPHWVPKAKSVSPKMVSVLTACSPRVLAHRNGPSAFEHHR